jgi:hypothetical protein
LLLLEELVLYLGEVGASLDAGDTVSSFMTAVDGGFPQKQGSSLDNSQIIQRLVGIITSNRFV